MASYCTSIYHVVWNGTRPLHSISAPNMYYRMRYAAHTINIAHVSVQNNLPMITIPMLLLVAGLLAPMTRSGIDLGTSHLMYLVTSLFFILIFVFSLSLNFCVCACLSGWGYDFELLPNHRAMADFSSGVSSLFWMRWCLGLRWPRLAGYSSRLLFGE